MVSHEHLTETFMIYNVQKILCHTQDHALVLKQPVLESQEYLHSKSYIHGSVKARSVLVGRDLSVKLWGLGSAYRRKTNTGSVEDVEMRKWQAPEVLARQPLQQSSDV